MTLDPQQPEGNKKILIGVVTGLAVVAVAIGAFVYMGKDDAGAPAAQVATTQAPETQPAAGEGEQQAAQTQDQAPVGDFNGTPVRPGNPVVAKVDGEEITRVDVYNFIQLMPPQIQQLPATQVYPMALDQVINTRLIQNKAEAANLEETPEFKREVEMAKQQIARNMYVEKTVGERISEASLRKKYDQLVANIPNVEERKASHILVETKEAADDVLKRLKEGADFNAVAKTESKDPTAAQNAGDLGWFTKDAMIPEFADAAFSMKKGAVSSEPVQTQFGWHVIKLEDVRTQPKPTFDQVREALEMQARRENLESLVNDWRKAAKIEVYDINGDPLQQEQSAAPQDVAPAAAPEQAEQQAPAAQ